MGVMPETSAVTTYHVRYLTSVDGLLLHLRCWLPDAPPTLVVVIAHGLGGHGGYYHTSLVPYLATWGAAVYAPDFRGHGLSDGGRGDIGRVGLLLHDLDAALRAARAAHPGLPIFVIGESMGTPLAVNYCATYPQAVWLNGIILASCLVAPQMEPECAEIWRFVSGVLRDLRRPIVPLAERADTCIRNPALLAEMANDPLYNTHISPRFVAAMWLHMRRARWVAAQLSVPVLILQGEADAIINWRATRAFFAHIGSPDKALHIFPEAYHAVLHDPSAPEVRAVLRAWLLRHI